MLGSILGGLATPTEAAGVGGMGALLLAAARGQLNVKRLEEVMQSFLPDGAPEHRGARTVSRGGDGIPAIARHAKAGQLLFHAVARARGIRHQNHGTAALAIGLQRGTGIGQRLDPVMHTAPQIDEQRVICVRNFRKGLDDPGHDKPFTGGSIERCMTNSTRLHQSECR